MASNFKITSHQSSENLHLKLIGDFDGSSAWQLLNLLRKASKGFNRIIIHTNGLNNIYPFGVHTFHQILSNLARDQIRLLFTGEKADQISPEKNLRVYPSQYSNKESRMPQGQERG
jgi:anti-anti-sigma regulatory factor